MIDYEIRTGSTGPVFSGHLPRDIDRAMFDAIDDIANQGQADVHTILDASIRHPTPYYETQITVDRVTPGRRIVNDRGIVYGPWLAGTSSRNRTTSFKGYHAFRRAAQGLQAKIPAILAPYIRRALGN